MKTTTAYILITAIVSLCSCGSDNRSEQPKIVEIENQLDTIACGNIKGLIEVEYYLNSQKLEYLTTNETITAVFNFKGIWVLSPPN